MMKRTLVLGASLKEERYSNKAIRSLRNNGHEVIAIGLKKGLVEDVTIEQDKYPYKLIHTVTMYLGESRQLDYQDYILSLKPKRIIFNPGAENPSLTLRAKNMGIETLNACTLVMLSTGQY